MVRHIIVLLCHVGDIYVFVSSCKCYSRLVNVCHGFVPSCFCYFCHSNVLHAHACHAIVCHAIVTSCKCLSCNRGHVNERPTSAPSCVPRWLHIEIVLIKNKIIPTRLMTLCKHRLAQPAFNSPTAFNWNRAAEKCNQRDCRIAGKWRMK